MAERNWAIIVHGGARPLAPTQIGPNRKGCAKAAAAGAEVLKRGGTAIEAARVAVCVLEDDINFNAGHGSVANAAGQIEMDAAIMDGETLAIGAVAAVRNLCNPIEAAAALLDQPSILLVGSGAEQFARARGLAFADVSAEPLPSALESHDTVGCVAMDQAGHFAAATSTGGLANTPPGRVGDAPLPGCGFYADDAIGGVSLSGEGEAIARLLLATRVMRAMEDRPAPEAACTIIDPLKRLGAEAGVIAIDAQGRFGFHHNSDHFAVAYAAADCPLHACTHFSERLDPHG